MPRPARRAAQHTREDVTTTPTRPRHTNAITADIPPFMLETPPHAPFLTTPVPPSNNPGNSIVPDQRNRNPRTQQQTPTGNGIPQTNAPDNSQLSSNALGSNMSEVGHMEEQSLLESVHHDIEEAKELYGLRDISSLATWTLSSAKPGCSLAQLRHPNPAYFWQSDGPQPHTLTLHFFKLVAIVKMRIYLDFDLDESYTPTKMKFFAGMSEAGLVEFGSWVTETTDPETGEVHSSIEGVRGWIEIPLKGVGGRETKYHDGIDSDDLITTKMEDSSIIPGLLGGDVLKAMVVQVRICENHQNGKDTHVRGFQVFAKDELGVKEFRKVVKKNKTPTGDDEVDGEEVEEEVIGLQPADWMGEPEIR